MLISSEQGMKKAFLSVDVGGTKAKGKGKGEKVGGVFVSKGNG